jgi:undecaprenyl diphosphate synthase
MKPKHVAIIMDGNRRWARERGLDPKEGHKEGIEALERTVRACKKFGIELLTVYALSTENLVSREESEINSLFSLINSGFAEKFPILKKEEVRVNFLGNIEKLPFSVKKTLQITKKALSANSGLVLNIALNYGSREEITKAAEKFKKGTEEEFSSFLYTKGLPDPELMIRTGGEKRLSNFLLWQLSYTELYFTDTLWPDFNEEELSKALEDYRKRKRNFGS